MGKRQREKRTTKPRRSTQQLRRHPPSRKTKKRILIVVEGQVTEPIYFAGLKQRPDIREGYTITVKSGKGGSATQCVKKAQSEKERVDDGDPFDEIWCVLDVEDKTQRAQLDSALSVAADEGIEVALSCPCFEVWLLAHFEKTARRVADAREMIDTLSKIWQREFQTPYTKNDPRLYDRLADLTETAIENARQVREQHFPAGTHRADRNSSTEVYKLVDRLMHGE